MRTRSKLIFAGLIAAMLMALAVGEASANRLSISHARLFRIEWSSLELESVGIAAVRCAVTLEGSFHSTTIPKINNLLIGHITRASIKNNNCITGSATILSETLPWHITYRGFVEALPNITALRVLLIGASFRVNNAITRCLARTTVEQPAIGVIQEAEASGGEGNRIFRRAVPDSSAGILCRGVEGGGNITGRFRSAGELREVEGGTPGTRNILVRLI